MCTEIEFGTDITKWRKQFGVSDNLITVDPDVRKMFHDNKFAVDVEVRFHIVSSCYSFLTLNRTIIGYTFSQRTDGGHFPTISSPREARV